jgi:hypothetical protein
MMRWPRIGGFLAGRVSRRYRMLLSCVFALIAVGVVVGAVGDGPWTVPKALVGTWEGNSLFYVPFFEKGASQGEHSDEPVAIRIHIASDGSVDGQVGTARLVGCKINRNRGWRGRMLNLWTDYVICDGWLEGPVFSADRETKRSFAFPFNEEGGTIGASLQVLQKGRVPFPIFPHLRQLTKQRPTRAPEATR